MIRRRHRALLACTAAAVLGGLGLLAGPASAAPGDLDANFGAAGRVVTDVNPGGGDRAEAVAVQPDGKLVVAVKGPFQNATPSDLALVRYERDGGLDASFGTGGKISTEIVAYDVTVQRDGKILVAGYAAGQQFVRGGSLSRGRQRPSSAATSAGQDPKSALEQVFCASEHMFGVYLGDGGPSGPSLGAAGGVIEGRGRDEHWRREAPRAEERLDT